jgi:hypothetical protein
MVGASEAAIELRKAPRDARDGGTYSDRHCVMDSGGLVGIGRNESSQELSDHDRSLALGTLAVHTSSREPDTDG